jgi:hypothetical protein
MRGMDTERRFTGPLALVAILAVMLLVYALAYELLGTSYLTQDITTGQTSVLVEYRSQWQVFLFRPAAAAESWITRRDIRCYHDPRMTK